MQYLICYLLLCRSPLISAEERRHINAEIHYNHTESGFMGAVQPSDAAGRETARGCRMLTPENFIQMSGLVSDIYFLSMLFSEISIHP